MRITFVIGHTLNAEGSEQRVEGQKEAVLYDRKYALLCPKTGT